MVILFWGSSGIFKLCCYYRVISLWDSSPADSPFLDISAVAAPQFLPLQASNAAKHQKYYTPPRPTYLGLWLTMHRLRPRTFHKGKVNRQWHLKIATKWMSPLEENCRHSSVLFFWAFTKVFVGCKCSFKPIKQPHVSVHLQEKTDRCRLNPHLTESLVCVSGWLCFHHACKIPEKERGVKSAPSDERPLPQAGMLIIPAKLPELEEKWTLALP